MNIVAFDLSLVATGWAYLDEQELVSSGVFLPTKLIGIARLRHLREQVLSTAHGADVVIIEGYSYGAKGNAILNLAELGGVIRVALADREQPFVDIPPASVKLFATGKGNAPKDQMLAAAIRKLGYARHDHNEADALWLLKMAKRYYLDDIREQTIAEGRALEKVKWANLSAAAAAR